MKLKAFNLKILRFILKMINSTSSDMTNSEALFLIIMIDYRDRKQLEQMFFLWIFRKQQSNKNNLKLTEP